MEREMDIQVCLAKMTEPQQTETWERIETKKIFGL